MVVYQMFGQVLNFSRLNTDIPKSSQDYLDMDMALDNIVPEDLNWRHTDEGPE